MRCRVSASRGTGSNILWKYDIGSDMIEEKMYEGSVGLIN